MVVGVVVVVAVVDLLAPKVIDFPVGVLEE